MSSDPALRERRARLTAAMEAASVDTMVVYGNAWQGDYFRYVAGFRTLEGQGLAIVQSDGTISVFMDSNIDVERSGDVTGADVAYAPELLSQVEAVLDRGGNRVIGAAPYRLLPRRLAVRTGTKGIADHTSLLDHLLMVKSPAELAAMRKAAAMADAGYDVFRKAVRVGRADYEVIAEVERFYRASGVEDNFMIIGVGGPEVRGMAPPTGRRIAKGDMVTTELTPCVDGYYAQICRTLVAGEPNAEQQKVFQIYLDAMEAGIAVVRPGVTAADIARAENDVMRGHGLGEYVTSEYTRVRGHGLGLFPDTKPHILEDVDTVIEEDMTLIVHPNTYNPTVGYMVLGDGLIVTATGSENLIRTPRALFSVAA
jgi:Xaa-Pro dipeptidase